MMQDGIHLQAELLVNLCDHLVDQRFGNFVYLAPRLDELGHQGFHAFFGQRVTFIFRFESGGGNDIIEQRGSLSCFFLHGNRLFLFTFFGHMIPLSYSSSFNSFKSCSLVASSLISF